MQNLQFFLLAIKDIGLLINIPQKKLIEETEQSLIHEKWNEDIKQKLKQQKLQNN